VICREPRGGRPPGHREVPAVVGTILLAAGLAACASGLPASPPAGSAGTAVAPTPTAIAPSPGETSWALVPPTAVPGLGAPPDAVLGGLTGQPPVPGSLGTFTWDGLVSDGPWVVPPSGGVAGTGQPLSVAFAPALRPSTWRARWAPVTGPAAGAPTAAGDGAGVPIVVAAPGLAGTWSLLVEASFGEGREGAWFWRVEVPR
jgi:hypothetical protein